MAYRGGPGCFTEPPETSWSYIQLAFQTPCRQTVQHVHMVVINASDNSRNVLHQNSGQCSATGSKYLNHAGKLKYMTTVKNNNDFSIEYSSELVENIKMDLPD
jgi:hypothetical protein